MVRSQTTINVSQEVLAVVDELARASGVSRSKLFDLAARQFVGWASQLSSEQLRVLTEAKVREPVTGYVRKPSQADIAEQEAEAVKQAIEASEAAIAKSLGISLELLRKTPIGNLTSSHVAPVIRRKRS